MELESKGYLATLSLSTDPRWRNNLIYLFGLDTYGNTMFSGDPYSRWYGILASELNFHLNGTFGDRDVVSVADAFGETILYYSTRNPATGMPQRKVAADPGRLRLLSGLRVRRGEGVLLSHRDGPGAYCSPSRVKDRMRLRRSPLLRDNSLSSRPGDRLVMTDLPIRYRPALDSFADSVLSPQIV